MSFNNTFNDSIYIANVLFDGIGDKAYFLDKSNNKTDTLSSEKLTKLSSCQNYEITKVYEYITYIHINNTLVKHKDCISIEIKQLGFGFIDVSICIADLSADNTTHNDNIIDYDSDDDDYDDEILGLNDNKVGEIKWNKQVNMNKYNRDFLVKSFYKGIMKRRLKLIKLKNPSFSF